jgi:hypothetical protein
MKTLLLILALAASASAEHTVKSYREAKAKGGEDAGLAEVYLAGIAHGFSWVNISAKDDSREPLFCAPEKMALQTANYEQILESFLKRRSPNLENAPLGMVLLFALKDAFPCTKPAH